MSKLKMSSGLVSFLASNGQPCEAPWSYRWEAQGHTHGLQLELKLERLHAQRLCVGGL